MKTLYAIILVAALGVVVATGGFLGAQVWAQSGDIRENQVTLRMLSDKVDLILKHLHIPYGE